MAPVFSFVAGALLSFGLIFSVLINPAKVLNFLDIAGAWDPSLAITMAVAVMVTAIGYRALFRTQGPACADAFHIPVKHEIDGRLMGGAALFGLGWGLVGFCPGPALAALSVAAVPAFTFVIAMLIGMALARRFAT